MITPNLVTQPGEYVSIVVANTSSYRLLNSKRTVKKAVPLPESLAFAADRAGLSLSKVLQDALKQRLRMRRLVCYSACCARSSALRSGV